MDPKPEIAIKNNHLKFTRLRIIKNLIIISCAFLLLFSAYNGLSMLQSTMNGNKGIGSASQAVLYLTMAVSSLLLPKYTILKLGCKMALLFGMVLFLPYMTANAYPTWFTMIPSAVLLGIGGAILWASLCTYFNKAAGMYCSLAEECVQGKEISNATSTPCGESFVFQDRMYEEITFLPELEDEYKIINQNYDGSYRNECRVGSMCSYVKISLEDNQYLKVIMKNALIQHDKQPELEEKGDKNYLSQCSQSTGTLLLEIPINTEKCIMDIDQGENSELVIPRKDDKIFKEHLKNFVSSDNEIETNNANVANMKLSTIDSINTVISENTSKFSEIESITARFFGCFGIMYLTSQVWGNLISYYVLNINSGQNVTSTSYHSCGAGFCNSVYEATSDGTNEIPSSTRYTFIGITATLGVVASLLVFLFLDRLDTGKGTVTFSWSQATATLIQLKKKEQLFIIPLSMCFGMSQGFYHADFTKSYIQCAWSISHVGLVTIFYGLAAAISSMMSGCLVKYVGRIPVVLFGLILHLGADIFLLVWMPDSENHSMFYLAAALWGAMIGVFFSQIPAFYGLLFKNDAEAAYASHYFCSSMGWTISFAYSDYLCTSTKIYILMAISCLGIIGYLVADRIFRSKKSF